MKKIKDIISEMNGELGKEDLIKQENRLIATVMSRMLFVLAIIWFFVMFFLSNDSMELNLIFFAVFFCSSIILVFLRNPSINPNLNTLIISMIFSGIVFFLFFRLFKSLSYLIWIILAMEMIFAMFVTRKIMAFIVSTTFFITIIIALMFPDKYNIKPGLIFYVGLLIAYVAMALILYFLNSISKERYKKIQYRLMVEKEQKEEITALYEEIAASEEELREKNELLVSMAYYDSLTGLPNRKMILETIEHQIEVSKSDNKKFYVVYIDADSFKKVNDAMGHFVGDEFLKFISEKIKDTIHPEDLVGRIGGDEFAYIIKRDISSEEAKAEVEKIRNVFQTPFQLRTIEIVMTASFGIASYPKDGDTIIKLLKNADLSMYKAKEMGKNRVQFFDINLRDDFLKEARMEKFLAKALENEELYLVYQPQFSIEPMGIRGFEALLRWNSKELGNVSPLVFIPKAEEMRMIIPIGNWVLKKACEKFIHFKKLYNQELMISVNISMIQIEEEDFVSTVKNIIDETGMNPGMLELEITESESTEEFVKLNSKLQQLKSLGVRIALDDFGTGYSSLSHLKKLPIDVLKIDKSFIEDLKEEIEGVHIVKDIISLVHNLNIETVVEGVEEEGQLNILKDYKCDYVQGFYLSLPLKEDEAIELLKRSSHC